MNWVGFGIACIELLDTIVEKLKQSEWYRQGVAAEQAREKQAADQLQAHYDEIAAAPVSVDDAVERLRARAAASDAAGADDHH